MSKEQMLADAATTRLFQRAWKLYPTKDYLLESDYAPDQKEPKKPTFQTKGKVPKRDTFFWGGRNKFWNDAQTRLSSAISRISRLEPNIEDLALVSVIGPGRFLTWSHKAAEDFFTNQASMSRKGKLGTPSVDDELFGEAALRDELRNPVKKDDENVDEAWARREPLRNFWRDREGVPDHEVEHLNEEQTKIFRKYVQSIEKGMTPKPDLSERGAKKPDPLYEAYLWDAPKDDSFNRVTTRQGLEWLQGCNADLGQENTHYPFVAGPQPRAEPNRKLRPVERIISSRPAQVAALNMSPECSFVTSNVSTNSILGAGKRVTLESHKNSNGIVRGGPFLIDRGGKLKHAYLVRWVKKSQNENGEDGGTVLLSRSRLVPTDKTLNIEPTAAKDIDLSPFLASVNRWGEEVRGGVLFNDWLKLARIVLDIYRRRSMLFDGCKEKVSRIFLTHFKDSAMTIKTFVETELLEKNKPLRVMQSTNAPLRMVGSTLPSDLMRLERRMLGPLRRSLFHYDVTEALSTFLVRHRALTNDVRCLLSLLDPTNLDLKPGDFLKSSSGIVDVLSEEVEKASPTLRFKTDGFNEKFETLFAKLLLDSESFNNCLDECLDRGSADSLTCRAHVKAFVDTCDEVHEIIHASSDFRADVILTNVLNRVAIHHFAARALLSLEILSDASADDLKRFSHPAAVEACKRRLRAPLSSSRQEHEKWRRILEDGLVAFAELSVSPFLVESCRSLVEKKKSKTEKGRSDRIRACLLDATALCCGIGGRERGKKESRDVFAPQLCSRLHVNHDKEMERNRARREALNQVMTLYHVIAGDQGIAQCFLQKGIRNNTYARSCHRDNCAGKRPTGAGTADDLYCHFTDIKISDKEYVRECVTNEQSDSVGRTRVLRFSVNNDMPNDVLFTCSNEEASDAIAKWSELTGSEKEEYLKLCREFLTELWQTLGSVLSQHSTFISKKGSEDPSELFKKFKNFLVGDISVIKDIKLVEVLAEGLRTTKMSFIGNNYRDSGFLVDLFQKRIKCTGSKGGDRIVYVDSETESFESNGKSLWLTSTFKLQCIEDLRLKSEPSKKTTEMKLMDVTEAKELWKRSEIVKADQKLRSASEKAVKHISDIFQLQHDEDTRFALLAHLAGYAKLNPVGALEGTLRMLEFATEEILVVASERWKKLYRDDAKLEVRKRAFQVLAAVEKDFENEMSNLKDDEVSALLAHSALSPKLRTGQGINTKLTPLLVSIDETRDNPLPTDNEDIISKLAATFLPGITVGMWLLATPATAKSEPYVLRIEKALEKVNQKCAPQKGLDKCASQTHELAEASDLTRYGQESRCKWKLTRRGPTIAKAGTVLMCLKQTTPSKPLAGELKNLQNKILSDIHRHFVGFDPRSVTDFDTGLENVMKSLKSNTKDLTDDERMREQVRAFKSLYDTRDGKNELSTLSIDTLMYVNEAYVVTRAKNLDPYVGFLQRGFLGSGPCLVSRLIVENKISISLEISENSKNATLKNFYEKLCVFIFAREAINMLKLAKSLLRRERRLVVNRLHPHVLALLLLRRRDFDHRKPTSSAQQSQAASESEKLGINDMMNLVSLIRSRILTEDRDRVGYEPVKNDEEIAKILVDETLSIMEMFEKDVRERTDNYFKTHVTKETSDAPFVLHASGQSSQVRTQRSFPFMTISQTRDHPFDTDDMEELLERPLLSRDLIEIRNKISCAKPARSSECVLSDVPDLSGECVPDLFGLQCWEDVLALPPERTGKRMVASCVTADSSEVANLRDFVRSAVSTSGISYTDALGEKVIDVILRLVHLLRDGALTPRDALRSASERRWKCVGDDTDTELCALFRSICMNIILNGYRKIVAAPRVIFFNFVNSKEMSFDVHLESLGAESADLVEPIRSELEERLFGRFSLRIGDPERRDWKLRLRQSSGRYCIHNLVDIAERTPGGGEWELVLARRLATTQNSPASSSSAVGAAAAPKPKKFRLVSKSVESEKNLELCCAIRSIFQVSTSPNLCQRLINIAMLGSEDVQSFYAREGQIPHLLTFL